MERLGNAAGGEPLALADLRDGRGGGLRIERVGDPVPIGDPRGDRDGPVAPGRDDPVDRLRAHQAVERLLVLRRDERPPIRVLEAGRERIAIAGDHEQAALARGPQQPELGRSGA